MSQKSHLKLLTAQFYLEHSVSQKWKSFFRFPESTLFRAVPGPTSSVFEVAPGPKSPVFQVDPGPTSPVFQVVPGPKSPVFQVVPGPKSPVVQVVPGHKSPVFQVVPGPTSRPPNYENVDLFKEWLFFHNDALQKKSFVVFGLVTA